MSENNFVKFYLWVTICVLGSLFYRCSQKVDVPNIEPENQNFVYIEDHAFKLQNDTFFPLMVNYVVSYNIDADGNFIVEPDGDYGALLSPKAEGNEAVQMQFEAHFTILKELGFNTARVCLDRIGRNVNGEHYYGADKDFYLSNPADVQSILAGFDLLVAAAKKADLRLMLLIRSPFPFYEDLCSFTKELLQHYQNEPTIFAYDFMNEPLYFDPKTERDKQDVVEIVTQWKQMMTDYAPKQLFTIGLAEPIEVFSWDCSLLPVDFIAFHTYHPLRIPSEIYWYAKYGGKPWMIGEIGFGADDTLISYDLQADFVRDAYQLVRDAGGSGFGWWQFQDIAIVSAIANQRNHIDNSLLDFFVNQKYDEFYDANFMGLLNLNGQTTTADGNYTIQGTIKPAARQFATLQRDYEPRPLVEPVNYYNMLGYNNIRITGSVVDAQTNAPIAGALIRAWNSDWSIGINTYSNEQGNFTLYCNTPVVAFKIAAPGYKLDFNTYKELTYKPLVENASDVNNLPNKNLTYYDISHFPFVDTTFTNGLKVMSFLPEKFCQASWESDFGTIALSPVYDNFAKK